MWCEVFCKNIYQVKLKKSGSFKTDTQQYSHAAIGTVVLKSQRDILYCLFQFGESECLRWSCKGQNKNTVSAKQSNSPVSLVRPQVTTPFSSLVRSQATTFCLSPNRTFVCDHLQLRLI